MREIVPDILTWSWFSEPHHYYFNGHLVRVPDGSICIDPVEPAEDDLEAIGIEGVTRILLTNRNHSRAANRVRDRTGARTAIHGTASYEDKVGTAVVTFEDSVTSIDTIVTASTEIGYPAQLATQ